MWFTLYADGKSWEARVVFAKGMYRLDPFFSTYVVGKAPVQYLGKHPMQLAYTSLLALLRAADRKGLQVYLENSREVSPNGN